ERCLVTHLVLGSRETATRMALALRDPAAAESLVARGRRQGVDYREELIAARDSAAFVVARAAGGGAVVGPDSSAAGWSVMRVEALIPARPRTWAEARPKATGRWYAERCE